METFFLIVAGLSGVVMITAYHHDAISGLTKPAAILFIISVLILYFFGEFWEPSELPKIPIR